MPRSGLALKYQIDTCASVIDRDYRGNVMVLLDNKSQNPFEVKSGDCIAQMILFQISNPPVIPVNSLDNTTRGTNGFGSTGINEPMVRSLKEQEPTITSLLDTENILDPWTDTTPTTVHKIVDSIKTTDGIPPYNIWLSNDPFDNRLTVQIDLKGQHPTLGMLFLQYNQRKRLQLLDMALSTPGNRVIKWRSTIRHGYIISIDGEPIQTSKDVEQAVLTAKKAKQLKLSCIFATEKRYGTHPIDRNLTLYFDQIHAFATHIQPADQDHIKQLKELGLNTDAPPWEEPEPEGYSPTVRNLPSLNPDLTPAEAPVQTSPAELPTDPDIGKSFTKKKLMQCEDWPEWQASCYKQLDQYQQQEMFSEPMPLSENNAASFMLWTYIWKMCETKKAHMVLDGARNQDLTTFGHTYANSLDAPSERLFWALVAKLGLIAVGADVSNAFVEAQAPHAPVYISRLVGKSPAKTANSNGM